MSSRTLKEKKEEKIKWKIYPVTYCTSNFILFYCCTSNKYICFFSVEVKRSWNDYESNRLFGRSLNTENPLNSFCVQK